MSTPNLRKGRPVLFRTLADQLLELKEVKAKKTYIAAKLHLQKLKSFFGDMHLKDITEATWERYILESKRKNPNRRIRDDKKYMSQVIRLAYYERVIPRVIVLQVPDLPSRPGREITKLELQRLLLKAGPELKFQIEIAYKMGLRLREMLNLKWDRFDWTQKMIHLRPEDVKTRRGRKVPINPDLLERLREKWESSNSPYVFSHRWNPKSPSSQIMHRWRKCKKEAGVEARWHDLRHTCATLMLRRGVKSHVAKVYLGMSERVLTTIYLHLNNDDLWAAAKAMTEKTRKRRPELERAALRKK